RSSIAELLEKEDFPTSGEFAARALTLEGARHYLSRKLSGPSSTAAREVQLPPRQPAPEARPGPRGRPVDCRDAVRPRPPPPPRPGFEGGPALCAAEERLRRGWVSVRGDLLICLEHEMKGVFGTLQKALEMLRHSRANPAEMPSLAREAVHILDTF